MSEFSFMTSLDIRFFCFFSLHRFGSFNVTPRARLASKDEKNDKGDKDEKESNIYGDSLMIRRESIRSVELLEGGGTISSLEFSQILRSPPKSL